MSFPYIPPQLFLVMSQLMLLLGSASTSWVIFLLLFSHFLFCLPAFFIDIIFLGSKITADGNCSHQIERCLLLGRLLNSILKSRDITLPTKVHIVKAMVFPVVMYGCESWTIKRAEHWITDAFELWFLSSLLRAPWTARSKQSILKEINPEYSLNDWCWSWSSNTLAMWCEELTHWKRPWAGKDWGQDEKGTTEDETVGWHHQLNGHESEQTLRDGEGQGGLACCSPWGRKELNTT